MTERTHSRRLVRAVQREHAAQAPADQAHLASALVVQVADLLLERAGMPAAESRRCARSPRSARRSRGCCRKSLSAISVPSSAMKPGSSSTGCPSPRGARGSIGRSTAASPFRAARAARSPGAAGGACRRRFVFGPSAHYPRECVLKCHAPSTERKARSRSSTAPQTGNAATSFCVAALKATNSWKAWSSSVWPPDSA